MSDCVEWESSRKLYDLKWQFCEVKLWSQFHGGPMTFSISQHSCSIEILAFSSVAASICFRLSFTSASRFVAFSRCRSEMCESGWNFSPSSAHFRFERIKMMLSKSHECCMTSIGSWKSPATRNSLPHRDNVDKVHKFTDSVSSTSALTSSTFWDFTCYSRKQKKSFDSVIVKEKNIIENFFML